MHISYAQEKASCHGIFSQRATSSPKYPMNQRPIAFGLVLILFVLGGESDMCIVSKLSSPRSREVGFGDLFTAAKDVATKFKEQESCKAYLVTEYPRLRGGGKSQPTSSTYSQRKGPKGISKDRGEERSLHPGSRCSRTIPVQTIQLAGPR